MNSLKEYFNLLLQLDQVYRPKTAPQKFAYSEELSEVVKTCSICLA